MRAIARIGHCCVSVAVAAGLVLATTFAAATGAATLPAPPDRPALTAGTLTAVYQRNHDYLVAAARAALRTGDPDRARVLTALAAPGRDYLDVSAVGDGQVVEVIGDLVHANRIAIVVPGSDTTVDTYDFFGTRYAAAGGAAHELADELRRLAPDSHTAVIAWFGYAAPRTRSVDVLTMGRAIEGGAELRAFLRQLRQLNPAARLALVCHSYGSVVCASALPGLPATVTAALSAVEVVGSPGLGVPDAAALGTAVPLWAGRGRNDPIALVPHVTVRLFGVQLGFGPDPTAPAFGARPLPVGAAAHGQYFQPGSLALHNIAAIALGQSPSDNGVD